MKCGWGRQDHPRLCERQHLKYPFRPRTSRIWASCLPADRMRSALPVPSNLRVCVPYGPLVTGLLAQFSRVAVNRTVPTLDQAHMLSMFPIRTATARFPRTQTTVASFVMYIRTDPFGFAAVGSRTVSRSPSMARRRRQDWRSV